MPTLLQRGLSVPATSIYSFYLKGLRYLVSNPWMLLRIALFVLRETPKECINRQSRHWQKLHRAAIEKRCTTPFIHNATDFLKFLKFRDRLGSWMSLKVPSSGFLPTAFRTAPVISRATQSQDRAYLQLPTMATTTAPWPAAGPTRTYSTALLPCPQT